MLAFVDEAIAEIEDAAPRRRGARRGSRPGWRAGGADGDARRGLVDTIGRGWRDPRGAMAAAGRRRA